MPNCTLTHAAHDDKIYLVTAANMSIPAAVFTCIHCAKLWKAGNLPYGYITSLQVNAELLSQLVNKFADVEKFSNPDDSTAGGALNKLDLES